MCSLVMASRTSVFKLQRALLSRNYLELGTVNRSSDSSGPKAPPHFFWGDAYSVGQTVHFEDVVDRIRDQPEDVDQSLRRDG